MQLMINHRTHYLYTDIVNYTIQQLRLTPRDGFGQRVRRWEIRVNGHLQQHDDAHGNAAHLLVLDTPHEEINILATGEVETGLDIPPAHDPLPREVYLRATALTEMDVTLRKFAEQFRTGLMNERVLDDMMHAIVERVPYNRGATVVDTTAAEAFRSGHGVCQDHAHIFIACCRYLGIPARYVSGYLFTDDGTLLESHAWADAWLAAGWVSFDVSNRCRTNGVHVRLATGLDYRDACPVSGMRVGGGLETMTVGVRVSQLQSQQ
ncbi:Transglutaminase-like enzyme, putative cysteine protease [Methylobacillus rhizosphaerae]|uniref:Transglutaminase-like enzyme, putative cysteine protease n=1 Tax=Methylobacillus rhizosphaerae TaxID=551994 RepID=A0A239A2I8_9PROT|nr:transglutaminase family protein [Methylobacillus rhizosphaerae]SNR89521.1 Transglutaminase-like enzyme, putative cysteine protease [Methylobacillus rhizosphaerae]